MINVQWGFIFLLCVPTLSFVPASQTIGKQRDAVSLKALADSLIAGESTKNDGYLRWNRDGDTWKMQTAVTSFQRGSETVELHAQLHFGDESYFDFYNSPEFESFDHVHYELLVDEDLLSYEQGKWRLKKPIMASPNDQSLAKQYGWECQASRVNYTNSKWIHADLSRQEFLKLAEKESAVGKENVPLWKLASSPQSSSAAAEAVSALLVGPPTLAYSTRFVKRRLFTNLFLPGSSFANTLRALLWMTVPSPELSVILLDWSSLLQGGSNPNALSQVALPILNSLVKFDIPQIRRFLFGQVLVSSNPKQVTEKESSDWSLLVTKRNDHALDVLQKTLSESPSASVSTALLYGSSHCPDLHAKLVSLGFRPAKTTWRTAWSVQENEQGTILPALAAFLVFYLVIGALDWVGMMGDVSQGWVDGNYVDSGVAGALYLFRHVLFYLGMSKFLVDWTNSNE